VLRQERSSQFKGVSWVKGSKKWRAEFWDKAQNKEVYLGSFATEEDAAQACQGHASRKKSINAAAPTAAAAAAPTGKARMTNLGVAGLAGKAGLAPEQPTSPPPPPPPRPTSPRKLRRRLQPGLPPPPRPGPTARMLAPSTLGRRKKEARTRCRP
jgi:hypothetical protein